jgi:gamma-glutamylcyclotransferase (GGCT)/AIG2-like uncharacterized protein YtfP
VDDASDTEQFDPVEGELIAVYGTLMQGFENHDLANMGLCDFLGECAIPGVLSDCGTFPGLKLDGDGSVEAELYRCPSDVLPRLDRIEGATAADPLFTRTEIDLIDPQVGAWVYEYARPVAKLDRISSGSWRSYVTA